MQKDAKFINETNHRRGKGEMRKITRKNTNLGNIHNGIGISYLQFTCEYSHVYRGEQLKKGTS